MMKIIKTCAVSALITLLVLATAAQADVSIKKARKLGEKNLKDQMDQSYHYRVEYDTIIALPVHSKTVWKNDFYLLYFLKDDYFQVEMEIDKETGDAAILAMGEMAPPYHAMPTKTFNRRYFDVDSVMFYASGRQRLQQDSVRLVYFGVIPKLGKRGVIWEAFSSEGINYFSLAGPKLTFEQMVRDINTSQQKMGNFVADSIRMMDIMAEIERLQEMPEEDKRKLKLYPQTLDSLIAALKEERQELLKKFPNLVRSFPMTEPAEEEEK